MKKLDKLNTWGVRYECDEKGCGGNVAFTGQKMEIQTPVFIHVCNKCGTQKYLERPFPVIMQWPDGQPLPPEVQAIKDEQEKTPASAIIVDTTSPAKA